MPAPLQITLYVVLYTALAVLVIADIVRRRRAARSRGPASEPSPEVVERLRALLAGGKKIQAIRELRKDTGMGLAEAKDYVEGLPAEPPRGAP